jgi:hypothetical protein
MAATSRLIDFVQMGSLPPVSNPQSKEHEQLIEIFCRIPRTDEAEEIVRKQLKHRAKGTIDFWLPSEVGLKRYNPVTDPQLPLKPSGAKRQRKDKRPVGRPAKRRKVDGKRERDAK